MGVPEAAEALKSKIETEYKLPVPEVLQWLKDEQGMSAGQANFVLGYGTTHSRRWWKKDGNFLVVNDNPNVPTEGKIAGSDGVDRTNPDDWEDPSNLEDPMLQLQATAQGIGIAKRPAAAAARYLSRTFDLHDPDALWKGLQEVTEISPSQRKRLWRSWCSFVGVEPPIELVQQVEKKTLQEMGRTDEAAAISANGHRPKQKYVAIDGEINPTEPDDEAGLSYMQALQQAKLQVEKAQNEDGSGSLVGVMLTGMNETNQLVLKSILDKPQGSSNGHDKELRESERREIETRFQLAEQSFQNQLKLLEVQHNQSMEKIERMIQAIMAQSQQQPRKNWFEELDTYLPGLGQKFLAKIMDDKPASTITMPGMTDASGNPVGMSIDDWKTWQEIGLKKDAIKLVKDELPNIMDLGKRLAAASEKVARQQPGQRTVQRSQPRTDGQERSEPRLIDTNCANCKEELTYQEGAQAFRCPECYAVQTPQGALMTPNPPSERSGPTPPAPTRPRPEEPKPDVRREAPAPPEPAPPEAAGEASEYGAVDDFVPMRVA